MGRMSEDVSAQSTAASLFVPKTALEQALSKSKRTNFIKKKIFLNVIQQINSSARWSRLVLHMYIYNGSFIGLYYWHVSFNVHVFLFSFEYSQ